MNDDSAELAQLVALGAEQYVDETNIDALMHRAAIVWARIASQQKPDRPTPEYVHEFLSNAIRGALQKTVVKLTGTHKEVIAVTLTFATQELITFLIEDLGWKNLTPYQIPLEIIAGVFYLKLLGELNKASPKG